MKTMLNLAELEVWCRKQIEGTPQEDFAVAVLQASSQVVADEVDHAEWLDDAYPDPIPAKAKLVCTLLAKRSFLNPDSVISEGGIGPIGGDRYVEEMAKFLVLTEQEKADLASIPGIEVGAGVGGLWTVEIENRPRSRADDTIYLPDLDYRAEQWPVLSTRDFPELEPGVTPYGP